MKRDIRTRSMSAAVVSVVLALVGSLQLFPKEN